MTQHQTARRGNRNMHYRKVGPKVKAYQVPDNWFDEEANVPEWIKTSGRIWIQLYGKKGRLDCSNGAFSFRPGDWIVLHERGIDEPFWEWKIVPDKEFREKYKATGELH